VDDREERTGGAGNVAVNIARLGAHVTLLGYCGQDEAGDSLIALLERAGVRCRLERLHRQPTITKLRVISRHQQLLRLDFEELLKPERPRALLETFEAELIRADVVVLSDYGKGTLGRVQQLISVARGAGKPVMVDPKGMDFSRYRHATAMTPNLAEFEAVAGPCRTELELREKAEAMVTELALHALLITRGEHGMTLFESGKEPVHLAAHAQEVFDVTGAGDTVLSTLSGAVAAGLGYTEATILANLAAGLVVGKLGTAAVSAEELHAALASRRAEHHGVVSLDTLSGLVTFARQRGERIVLTNGCFDILHPGHIKYLRQARALGDRLIVLVNSDDSVKRLKGQGRPINALEHRMDMLAALECVDWVAPFHDDTPRAAICRLLPDVLVKGGDYPDVTAIAGHDCVLKHGGEIKILNFVEGFSTTRLIADIRGEQER
jgi:D-beta-D-heptose 7-phosphate kinase/D-beta-D-heptose 1-phosphate adenosyltransferase